MTTTIHEQATRLVADLDPKARAKTTRWANEPAVVNAKQHRFDVTREPDFVDDVTGESVWMHDDFAVIVYAEHLSAFRAFINCRGLAPCGRDAYRVSSLFHDASFTVPYAQLDAAVRKVA